MLSKKCIEDIKKLDIRPRTEKHIDELYERRIEIELEKFKPFDIIKKQNLLLDLYTDWDWMIYKETEADILQSNNDKCDDLYISYLEGKCEWDNPDFTDWTINVYMND